MSSHHALVVVKDLKRLPYEARVKANNALKRLIAEHGLRHTEGRHALAAIEISKNPLVDRVVITYVTEHHDGTWRNGKKS